MFGKVKFNLRNRECITISSESESDDDFSSSSSTTSRCGSIIDEIADCYSETLPRRITRQFLNDTCLKSRCSNYQEKEMHFNELVPSDRRNQIKMRSKLRNRSYLSLRLKDNDDEKINGIVDNLIQSTDKKRKLNQHSSSKKLQDEEMNSYSNRDVSFRDVKRKNMNSVLQGEAKLQDVCLSCGKIGEISCSHPLFEGGLCKEHMEMFQEWYFKYDHDGCSSYCSICCMGEKVVVCDDAECGRCYCSNCLEVMVAPGEYDRLSTLDKWLCYFCVENNTDSVLIIKRHDWMNRLQLLFTNNASKYPPPPVPVAPRNRRPLRVLSLFDGIATGLLALQQLGLKVQTFVASEIDESAIRLVQNRHPNVIHVGDITQLTNDDVDRMGPFDLVFGGSPCNDLSGANPRRRGLLDAEGTGCLFFDFYRILSAARPTRCRCSDEPDRPFFWLFENVLSMKVVERNRISRFLQCDPIVADARVVSAASRPRLFWGNLPHMSQLNLSSSPDDRLTVQSCLEKNRVATVEKLNTITTRPGCLYQGGARVPPVKHNGKDDVLWTTEIERIFGVPEHYTDVNNLGPRERLALLGRSWSVPVMRHLLAPLKEYFASTKVLQ